MFMYYYSDKNHASNYTIITYRYFSLQNWDKHHRTQDIIITIAYYEFYTYSKTLQVDMIACMIDQLVYNKIRLHKIQECIFKPCSLACL